MTDIKDHYEYIIIGGGIVGSSLAFELTNYSNDILLVDANHEGKATKAGAGIISGATTFADNDNLYNLVREASIYYPEYIEKLIQYTSLNTSYTPSDQVIVVSEHDKVDLFDEKKDQIFRRQSENNYPAKDSLVELNSEEFSEKFPDLRPVLKALYFTDAAQIDGHQLSMANIDAAKNRGLYYIEAKVTEVLSEGKKVTGIKTIDRQISGDHILIAGGAWSSHIANQLNFTLPIFPQRGQIIHLKLHDTISENLPIIISMKDFYSLSWPENRLIIGATRESNSGFSPRTTVDGVISVLQNGQEMISKFHVASIEEIRVGLRPYSEDRLPFIGKASSFHNLWMCTGHGPLGLTAGPYSAKLLVEMIQGDKSEFLENFNPNRNVQQNKMS